jgi:hypothetical protein
MIVVMVSVLWFVFQLATSSGTKYRFIKSIHKTIYESAVLTATNTKIVQFVIAGYPILLSTCRNAMANKRVFSFLANRMQVYCKSVVGYTPCLCIS